MGDFDRTDELLRELNTLATHYIEIGVVGSDSYEKLTVVDIGEIHEYGIDIRVTPKMRAFLHYNDIHLKKDTEYIKIPERSFIRSSYDKNKEKIFSYEDELDRVMDLQITAQDFLEKLGQACVDIIVEYMRNLSSPPNAAMTQMWKGSSNPLIDTGKLIGSIDYEIKKGSV